MTVLKTQWCFKKRSFFETQFRLCSLKAKGRDKWLIIKTM
ncbi:hypothetical protein M071_0088 [Bacteroides fragilis str. Ds-233]|nr:hypothetical protein M071_0088 [Bacteroides fragilis str. Ds-233]